MKTLAYIICYLIYPFSFLLPRSSRRMVFGSYHGSFSDNSKYLFIYALEHCPDKDICWLSINRATVRRVKQLGLPAYWVFTPIGIWKALRAKYWFVNSYASDILFCLSGRVTIVNLWHGVGLKRCDFNITSGALAERFVKQTFKERFYHPESFRRPDYVVSSTDFQSSMFATAFRVPVEKCLNLGYPRNTILTKPKNEVLAFVQRLEPKSTEALINKISAFATVYMYMPTWRDSQLNVFAQQFDLPAMNKVLAEQNAILLLKPHPNTHTEDISGFSNIVLVEKTIDVYGALPFTDVLITDYSSILYDYLLIPGKDVILFLYDYDDYVRDRDFFYPFAENVVGKQVSTFEELKQVVVDKDFKLDNSARQAILDKFWGETMKSGNDVCHNILVKLGLTE